MTRLSMCMAFVAAATLLAAPAASAADRNAAFKKADRNKNGSLNRGEFKVFIDILAKANDRLARRVVSNGPEGYDYAWRTADGNRDQKITAAELKRF